MHSNRWHHAGSSLRKRFTEVLLTAFLLNGSPPSSRFSGVSLADATIALANRSSMQHAVCFIMMPSNCVKSVQLLANWEPWECAQNIDGRLHWWLFVHCGRRNRQSRSGIFKPMLGTGKPADLCCQIPERGKSLNRSCPIPSWESWSLILSCQVKSPACKRHICILKYHGMRRLLDLNWAWSRCERLGLSHYIHLVSCWCPSWCLCPLWAWSSWSIQLGQAGFQGAQSKSGKCNILTQSCTCKPNKCSNDSNQSGYLHAASYGWYNGSSARSVTEAIEVLE